MFSSLIKFSVKTWITRNYTLPDIECAHVVSMTGSSGLGAKGAGEAGTAGAPAVVMNALNDALAPFGAKLCAQPFTPEKVLQALGKV